MRRDPKEYDQTKFVRKMNKDDQIAQNLRIWRLENPYQPRRRKQEEYVEDVLDR